jgi:hypothetical protein
MSSALVLMLMAWALPHARSSTEARTSAALVVASPLDLDPALIDRTRIELATRFRLREESWLRTALERVHRDPGPEESLQTAVDRAIAWLRRFDLASAKTAIDEGFRASARLPPSTTVIDGLIALSLVRAEVAQLEHDREGAKDAFALVLSLDPSRRLDPTAHPPPLIRSLEAARQARSGAPSIPVRFESKPIGATIFVGGEARGRTPSTLDLTPGPAAIWLLGDGLRPKLVLARVAPGLEIRAELEPTPEPIQLRLLVEAVRAGSGEVRIRAARSLAELLRVDALAILSASGAPPEIVEPPPALPRDPSEGTTRRVETKTEPRGLGLLFWSAIIGGGVSAGLGAYAFVDADARTKSFDSKLAMKNGAGFINGIDGASAADESRAIRNERIVGGVLVSVAALAAAAALWMLIAPDDPSP